MDDFVLKCRHCDTAIGLSSMVALVVGAVKFLRPVTMQCLNCGRTVRWSPGARVSHTRDFATKDVAEEPLLEYYYCDYGVNEIC